MRSEETTTRSRYSACGNHTTDYDNNHYYIRQLIFVSSLAIRCMERRCKAFQISTIRNFVVQISTDIAGSWSPYIQFLIRSKHSLNFCFTFQIGNIKRKAKEKIFILYEKKSLEILKFLKPPLLVHMSNKIQAKN